MAPISRRRRQDPDAEYHSDSVLDYIGPDGASQTPGPRAKTESGPSVAELMERLGAQQAQIEAMTRAQALADSRAAPTPQAPDPGPEPQLNLEGLPDPVTNPKEYGQALATRTVSWQNELGQYAQRKAQANAPRSMGDPDVLWQDFQEQFPEYAEDDSRIRFATAEVVRRLAARGIDAAKMLYTHSDQMFKAICEEYDSTFGSPISDDGGEVEHEQEPEPKPRRKTAKPARGEDDVGDDGDDGRTEGILGGTERGTPSVPRAPDTGGLIEDLRAIQRKTGYY